MCRERFGLAGMIDRFPWFGQVFVRAYGVSAEGARWIQAWSAEGAKYNSQGQEPSRARRVAPGQKRKPPRALKERNKYFALSVLTFSFPIYPGATRFAPLSACPWLLYFAPLALTLLVTYPTRA